MKVRSASSMRFSYGVAMFLAIIFVVCTAFISASAYAAEKPEPVKGLKWVSGYESVILTWKPVKSNEGTVKYEVRQGKTVKATNLTATKAKIKFNPYPTKKDGVANTATYDVYAYIDVKTENENGDIINQRLYSDKMTVADVEPVHPMYIVVETTCTATLYATKSSNKSAGKIRKGTRLVAYGGSRIKGENKRILVRVKKGKKLVTRYIKIGQVKTIKQRYNSKKLYSKATIESFINDKGLTSNPKGKKRLIFVNTYTQRLYLMRRSGTKWVIDEKYPRGLACNTGTNLKLTPYGVFRITGFWDRKPTTGTRWWCIFNHVAVHEKLTDSLGKPASTGCVRIADKEAQWFYDTIRAKTTIFVY